MISPNSVESAYKRSSERIVNLPLPSVAAVRLWDARKNLIALSEGLPIDPAMSGAQVAEIGWLCQNTANNPNYGFVCHYVCSGDL